MPLRTVVSRSFVILVLTLVSIAPIVATAAPLPDPLAGAAKQPAAAPRATWTVDTTADTVDAQIGDGRCADANGSCSLRAAVQEANATFGLDEITVPAGHYALTLGGADEDAAATGDLDIREDLTLVGPDGRDTTVLAAAVDDRVLDITCAAEVSLQGLTVRDGHAGSGGGIRSVGYLQLSDSAVVHNSAVMERPGADPSGNGGGIANRRGTVRLVNTEVTDNAAGYAGGGVENVEGEVAVIDSLFRNNDAGYEGGGIASGGWGGDAVLVFNSRFEDNSAGYEGGAVQLGSWAESALVVSRSSFDGNSADYSGGALELGSWGSTTVSIDASTFAGNTAGNQGGGLNAGNWGITTVTIRDSTFVENQSDGAGGGLHGGSWGTTQITLDNVTLSANGANSGAGLAYVGKGGLVLRNSTLSGNTATQSGGGLLASNHHDDVSAATLIHTTVFGNMAKRGSGVAVDRGSAVALLNSIVAGGSGSNCDMSQVGDVHGGPANLDSDGSCQLGGAAVDPQLGPLGDNGGLTRTHLPGPGSPAIDGADAADCPATDQRGAPRPHGAGCDIGAVEVGAAVPGVSGTAQEPPMPVVAKPERWRAPAACGAGSSPRPRPTSRPTATALPSATVEPTSVMTPTEDPSATATPEASPTTGAEKGVRVCASTTARVPAAIIAAAVESPERIHGWRQALDPGKPVGPFNPLRESLSLRNIGLAYSPLGNPLEFHVGCP
jgi:hypothetical protein